MARLIFKLHVLILPVAILLAAQLAGAQELRKLDRARGHEIVKQLKKDIEKNYYDPAFGGIDLDRHFGEAEKKIDEAQSVGQMFGIIGQTLVDFNDSHTRFVPPGRAATINYGWQMQAIGDTVYVVAVKPGSDADKKGVKPGDRVLTFDQYQPTRDNLSLLRYLYYSLRPKGGMRLQVQPPGQGTREVDVLAEVSQAHRVRDLTSEYGVREMLRDAQNERRRRRHIYYDDESVFIWKKPAFNLEDHQINDMMKKAKDSAAMILDLRGNPGGYVKSLERMVGAFFEKGTKIADVKGRKPMKPLTAQTGRESFSGDLVVLVDSESGSSAEVFARIVQIEGRGKVLGDKTSGKVMQSRGYGHTSGTGTVVRYGASVTNADLIMPDGQSLENVGVTPDEIILPTAEDLAASRDPVMARAGELLGLEMTPERAGSLFPIEWED